MGSRIHIKLASLINNPNIKIDIRSEVLEGQHEYGQGDIVVTTAFVKFATGTAESDYEFGFDLDSVDMTLGRDFNFFRDRNGHERLMRFLYENSINSTVMH